MFVAQLFAHDQPDVSDRQVRQGYGVVADIDQFYETGCQENQSHWIDANEYLFNHLGGSVMDHCIYIIVSFKHPTWVRQYQARGSCMA